MLENIGFGSMQNSARFLRKLTEKPFFKVDYFMIAFTHMFQLPHSALIYQDQANHYTLKSNVAWQAKGDNILMRSSFMTLN